MKSKHKNGEVSSCRVNHLEGMAKLNLDMDQMYKALKLKPIMMKKEKYLS